MGEYITDYHLHSRQSVDAGDTMAAYVSAAERDGISEICFTDHVDFSPGVKWHDYFNFDTYLAEIDEVRGISKDVKVLSGFELDYQWVYEAPLKRFISDKEVDFVIGSVHYVNDRLTMVRAYFDENGEDEAYRLHFDQVAASARSGLFDVLGHFDYPKRAGSLVCGPFPFEKFRDRLAEILKSAIDSDTGIEINAAGYSHPPEEPYPGLEILNLYRSLGGKLITFGSDSHHATTVGKNIMKARIHARQAGFREFALFEKRIPRFVPL